MNTVHSKPICPHCGSDDVIPFETDEDEGDETGPSLFIVLVSALVVLSVIFITGYFVALSIYIYFPACILICVAAAAWYVKKQEKYKSRRYKSKKKKIPQDYMCLECGAFFNS